MACPGGFEPPASASARLRSVRLSYGQVRVLLCASRKTPLYTTRCTKKIQRAVILRSVHAAGVDRGVLEGLLRIEVEKVVRGSAPVPHR